MPDPVQNLWLHTFLALAGLGAGLLLHLKWHPQRAAFSAGWDMLQSLKWLVPLLAALSLLSGSTGPWAVATQGLAGGGADLRGSLRHLLPHAAQAMAVLPHGLLPPWPLVLALPALLSFLLWRVYKFPYRYAARRVEPASRRWLVLAMGVSWLWLGAEIWAACKPMPEGPQTLRILVRWLAEAVMLAGLQVFLVRLVIGWDEPETPDDRQDAWLAFEQVLARWRGIMALAVLDLLWLLAWRTTGHPFDGPAGWLLVEAGLLFACLPVVVARLRGPWWLMAEASVRIFLNSLWPMAGIALTALALLLLVDFATQTLLGLVADVPLAWALFRILTALVLATVRSWLFLTFVLTLLRHGFKEAASQERMN